MSRLLRARTPTAQKSMCKNVVLRTHAQFILDSLSEIGLEVAHIHVYKQSYREVHLGGTIVSV